MHPELYTFEPYTHISIIEGSKKTTSLVPFLWVKEFPLRSSNESVQAILEFFLMLLRIFFYLGKADHELEGNLRTRPVKFSPKTKMTQTQHEFKSWKEGEVHFFQFFVFPMANQGPKKKYVS